MDAAQQALTNHDYFRGPIETLQGSLHDEAMDFISHHDVTQAYGVLCARVKNVATALSDATVLPTPALTYLRENAATLARSLSREIHRALCDLLPEEPVKNPEIPETYTSYTPQVSEDDMQEMEDVSTVCQHALLFLSEVFHLPLLSAVFLNEDIEQLLDAVLLLLKTPFLPIPNEQKILSMAMWILAGQRLPSTVVQKRTDIVTHIERIVMNTNDDTTHTHLLEGALKTLHNLLTTQLSLFPPQYYNSLESVLNHLVSPALSVRIQAAYALSGYTTAFLLQQSPSSECIASRKAISLSVVDFIEEQLGRRPKPRSRDRRYDSSSNMKLRDLLAAEIPQNAGKNPGKQVSWAFSVLSSLVVLSDGWVFTRSSFVSLVGDLIFATSRHKSGTMVSLHALVWRCLIWAFTRIKCIHPEEAARYDDKNPGDVLSRRAFKFLLQMSGQHLGPALVYALLSPKTSSDSSVVTSHEDEDVPRVALVLREMIKHSNSHGLQKAKALLAQMTSAIGSTEHLPMDPWDGQHILPGQLLNGALVEVSRTQLPGLMRSVTALESNSVRPLVETEVLRHWDDLFKVWAYCMSRTLQADLQIPSMELLKIWQALLLVQTQLTQSHGHLTSNPAFATRVIKIIAGFLSWVPEPADERHTPVMLATLRLSTTKQLWSITKSVFVSDWLAEASKSLLGSVCQANFPLDSEDVLNAWSELCSDLISTSSPGSLANLVVASQTQQQESELKRLLWNSVVASQKLTGSWQWTDFIEHLITPLSVWTMSESEHDKWTELLQHAIICARKETVQPNTVLDSMSQHITTETFLSSPDVMLSLTTHLQLNNENNVPHTFFTHLNDYLRLYSQLTQHVYPVLNLFDLFSSCIETGLGSVVVNFLGKLSEGLCLWIQDKSGLVAREQHDSIVMRFYSQALRAVQAAKPHVETLHILEAFLAAPFENISYGALGSRAVMNFWEAIKGDFDNTLHHDIPTSLKINLAACYDAFGGERPSFVSSNSDSESQSQMSMTTVPDSQPEAPMEDDPMEKIMLWASLYCPEKVIRCTSSLDDTPKCKGPSRSQTRGASSDDTAQAPVYKYSTSPNEKTLVISSRVSLRRKRDQVQPLSDSSHRNSSKPSTNDRSVASGSKPSVVLGKRPRTSSRLAAMKRRRTDSDPTEDPNAPEVLPEVDNAGEDRHLLSSKWHTAQPEEPSSHANSEIPSATVSLGWKFADVEPPLHRQVRRSSMSEEGSTDLKNSLPPPPCSMEVPTPSASSSSKPRKDYPGSTSHRGLDQANGIIGDTSILHMEHEDFDKEDGSVADPKAYIDPKAYDVTYGPEPEDESNGLIEDPEASDEEFVPFAMRGRMLTEPPLGDEHPIFEDTHTRAETAPLPLEYTHSLQDIPTSAALRVLREAYEAIAQENSDMPMQEVLAAQNLLNEMDGILHARLLRALRAPSLH